MSFKVRTLGGKLIILAGLTLFLCMLIFATLSWSILTLLSEHEARAGASMQLSVLKRNYKVQSEDFIQNLRNIAQDSAITTLAGTFPSSPSASSRQNAQQIVTLAAVRYRLVLPVLDIVTLKGVALAKLNQDASGGNALATGLTDLISPAVTNNGASGLLRMVIARAGAATPGDTAWVLSAAVPILNHAHKPIGAVIGVRSIDDSFALELMRRTGMNVVLCQDKHILGSSMRTPDLVSSVPEGNLCTIGMLNHIDGSQHYLALADFAQAQGQVIGSSSLVVVAIEPLNGFFERSDRDVEALVGLGVFVLALGTIVYTIITRMYFIRPLRRLQERVRTLAAANTTTVAMEEPAHKTDELTMLDRSFDLLSESLSESIAMTEQMGHLLTMSDALISTLNLENLLGEIVSRLGSIMSVKNVALLLYGREMLSPWAVALWEDKAMGQDVMAPVAPAQKGAVMVHADLANNITMAPTTKLAAFQASRGGASSRMGVGGRTYTRTRTQKEAEAAYGLRRPHIPRPALRELDLALSRIVMQRHKIAYGENIGQMHQERGEHWRQMALEAGYLSVIAVPLMFQEQAIGAFILYSDKPRQITREDIFLLRAAAVQTAVAIQNALLFAEVKEKNAALERMNHLKSQFLATVTHELRTPLHSIISYGGLLLEGFVEGEMNSEQEEHIQFMVRRAEDLSHLVDEMLDLSKIEADRMEVKVEPLVLEGSLDEVVNQLKPMANAKGLSLGLEMEQGLPPVLADSHRVRQVALNLVSNALKFTDKGGVTIRCMLLKDYDMVRVSVQDTGIGISAATLGFIFEAFRQADGSTTRRFGGTGLGLTIARKLIELQGGEVAVESIPGQGSTFSFALPVASASGNDM